MITKQADLSSGQKRKLARARRLKRRERQKARSKEPVIITYNDLDDDQLDAYDGIHEWWRVQKDLGGVAAPLTVAGFAGTGKSTLLGVALPALKNPDDSVVKVAYCAYTGKAANVLITKGLDASTIHSLIYNCVPEDDGKFVFELKDASEIDAELIVVDEASMVPDDMREDLESLGIPVLYTGDHGQLPPVAGNGNVMEKPRFKLETPHRQAMDSGIISMATLVRKGKAVTKGLMGVLSDAEKVGHALLKDTALLSSADIIICFKNTTREAINKRIREYRGHTHMFPEVGEKIICVKNNRNTRMVNGLVLEVLSMYEEGDLLLMDCKDEAGILYKGLKGFKNYFQGHPHPKIHGATLHDVFEFAYAITGHKSQGSQWDHVVIIEEVMFKSTTEMKRRWLYTVLTRAAKKLTWISRFH